MALAPRNAERASPFVVGLLVLVAIALALYSLLVAFATPDGGLALWPRANGPKKAPGEYLSLTANEAREIAQRGDGSLNFHRLRSLPVDAAIELAAVSNDEAILSLGGLKVISADAARELARCRCQALTLDGLTELPTDVAAALATYRGSPRCGAALHLHGLKRISESAATELARLPSGLLALPEITDLDEDAARALANFEGQAVFLGSFRSMPLGLAEALASFRSSAIILGSVEGLSLDAAAALAKFKGKRLCITLGDPSYELLKVLKTFPGELVVADGEGGLTVFPAGAESLGENDKDRQNP